MRKNRILCMVLCLCFCLMPCIAAAASTTDANEPIITSEKCSLTLNYAHGETTFSGLPVSLYHIADVSADFQYTLTKAFRKTELTLNGVSSTREWNEIRSTLESFIVSKDLDPDREMSTDRWGSVRFKDLAPGLYLVMPVKHSKGGVRYSFDSALIAVPGLDSRGSWTYDVTANPKPSIYRPEGNGGSYEDETYRVTKLWRDQGNRKNRPSSVKVDIICNRKIVKTVTLSAANNWSYSWTAEKNGDSWNVAERTEVDGYQSSVKKTGTSFTVINTIPGTTKPPDTGDSSHIGLYILLMSVSGLALVILGAAMRRNAEE